jgi:hypothetical protein
MSNAGPESVETDQTTDAILYVTATMLGVENDGAGQGGMAQPEASTTQIPASSPEYVLACMIGPRRLDRNVAQVMWDDIRKGESMVNPEALDRVCCSFETADAIAPYAAVRGLAGISPVTARLMGSDTGVMEGYRLHEHTQAVLGRFDELYTGKFTAEECKLLRTALGLQDMAKPLAFAIEGRTELQGVYNTMTIQTMLQDSESLSVDEKKLITLCASHDFIGMFMRGRISLDEARSGLAGIKKACAPQYRERVDDYLKAIYFADSTAYTSHATYQTPDGDMHSCAPVLNYLFQPDEQGPGFADAFQRRLFSMLWPS